MMKRVLYKPRITDAALFLLIRTHKKQAAEILYDSYANFLYLVIIRIVPQQEIAEKLLIATFKKVWCSIDEYDMENERIYTWMIGIARNLASENLVQSQNNHETEKIQAGVR